MINSKLQILFLCSHNAARSIMAEAILEHLSRVRFDAHCAGATPARSPHPMALELPRQAGIATEGLHSKSWSDFASPSARPMDAIIVMSDAVATLPSPAWPGEPVTVTWNFADPLEAEGNDEARKEVLRSVMYEIRKRLELMTNLPARSFERMRLRSELEQLTS